MVDMLVLLLPCCCHRWVAAGAAHDDVLSGPGTLRRALESLPVFHVQHLPALAQAHMPMHILQPPPPTSIYLSQAQPTSAVRQMSPHFNQQQQQQESCPERFAFVCDAQLWKAYMVLSFLSHVSCRSF
jgi:hypothetical protein